MEQILLGAGRALGALEVTCTEGQQDTPITDVRVLVGLYVSKQHTTLLDMPILHPKFYWTTDVLRGLVNLSEFHMKELMEQKV